MAINLPAACSELAMPAAGKPLSSLPHRAVPSGLNSAEKELVYMEETDARRRPLGSQGNDGCLEETAWFTRKRWMLGGDPLVHKETNGCLEETAWFTRKRWMLGGDCLSLLSTRLQNKQDLYHCPKRTHHLRPVPHPRPLLPCQLCRSLEDRCAAAQLLQL